MTVAYSSQIFAHFLQASAHALQESRWEACFAHSSEQILHILAHNACKSWLNLEPLASKRAHNAQIAAQSLHNAIHSLLPLAIQSVIQLSQVIKHAKHASIPFFWNCHYEIIFIANEFSQWVKGATDYLLKPCIIINKNYNIHTLFR